MSLARNLVYVLFFVGCADGASSVHSPDPPRAADRPGEPARTDEPPANLRTSRGVLVILEPGEPRSTAEAVATELGGFLNESLGDTGSYLVTLPNATRAEARNAGARARQLPGVQTAGGGSSRGQLEW